MASKAVDTIPAEKPPVAGATPAAVKIASRAETGLIAVTKDGETLEVHPSTVAAHVKAGWTL